MHDPPEQAGAFQRLKIAPAYKAVSDEIERGILDGVLAPGTALPTEQVLAERFGVNRSTVREAIRRIEQDGLLQRRAGRRLYVALPGLHQPMTRTLRERMLQHIGFRELWQVALELEPTLLARSARRQPLAQELVTRARSRPTPSQLCSALVVVLEAALARHLHLQTIDHRRRSTNLSLGS